MKNENVRISLYLPRKVKNEFRSKLAKKDTSMSEFLVRKIKEFLEHG